MKKALLGCLASLALAIPAAAGNLYVPLLDRDTSGSRQRTEVWIGNSGALERFYTATFLPAGTDGTPVSGTGSRASVLGARTVKLTGLTTTGNFGLLEISAAPQLQVEARLANSTGSGPVFSLPLPVITSTNALPSGSSAQLLGLGRSNAGAFTDLGVVNLDRQSTTQCAVSFFRANGTQIAGTANISVDPLSMRRFGDALGLLGENEVADARAQVTCDRTFYAFASVFSPSGGYLLVTGPTGSGASTLGGDPVPNPGNTVVYTLDGTVHTPAVGNESRQLVVPTGGALRLRRMVIELDVTPGAFTAGNTDKSHNIFWAHRGRFRSNTIGNINVFGPARNEVRNNSNVDVAPAAISAQQTSLVLQQGTTYRFRYLYNAETATITTTVSSGGVTVAAMEQPATAANRTLNVAASGFNLHIGHGVRPNVPEFPSYGWQYANLRVEMVPY